MTKKEEEMVEKKGWRKKDVRKYVVEERQNGERDGRVIRRGPESRLEEWENQGEEVKEERLKRKTKLHALSLQIKILIFFLSFFLLFSKFQRNFFYTINIHLFFFNNKTLLL